jgi:hypothetical protein
MPRSGDAKIEIEHVTYGAGTSGGVRSSTSIGSSVGGSSSTTGGAGSTTSGGTGGSALGVVCTAFCATFGRWTQIALAKGQERTME